MSDCHCHCHDLCAVHCGLPCRLPYTSLDGVPDNHWLHGLWFGHDVRTNACCLAQQPLAASESFCFWSCVTTVAVRRWTWSIIHRQILGKKGSRVSQLYKLGWSQYITDLTFETYTKFRKFPATAKLETSLRAQLCSMWAALLSMQLRYALTFPTSLFGFCVFWSIVNLSMWSRARPKA